MADLLYFNGFKRMKNFFSFYLLPFTFYLLPLAFSVFFFGGEARAQDEEQIPANIAPPAVKLISKEEKTALAGVTDVKDRTKLALELMDARLKKAEELNTQAAFNALLTELGSFHALMDDALKFLNRNDTRSGKMLNNYKRFEMALREFTPRLELIRREMPERYEYHVRKLLITVRDTRSKAVEPLFGTTVVPSGN